MSNDSLTIISPSNVVGTSENINSAPCGICRRQFSRYTCPKCNLPYCSLTCFRSPAHSECSEAFYRQEVENDIHSTPSKTAEERLRMLELLKRLEEDKDEGVDVLGDRDDDSDDSDDNENLENRLAKVDLNSASYDDIWSALTSAERDKFMKALSDPSSELAQQLLASEELETQTVEPWWERPADNEEAQQPVALGAPQRVRRWGDKPQLVDIPPSARKAAEIVGTSGPSLLYNICAVILAYGYITRYLSSSPLSAIPLEDSDHEESRKLFNRIVPFLTDRKSRTVLPSLSAMITDLWSRFEPDTMTPAFFSLIMRDAALLLRPSPVVTLSPAADGVKQEYADHPSSYALRALSDISILFQPPSSPSTRDARVVSPVAAKTAFYAARITSTPTYLLTALSDEMAARANLIEREGTTGSDVSGQGMTAPTSEINVDQKILKGTESNRDRIEVLT